MFEYAIEIIRATCLIIASVLILITAIGILRLKDEMDKIIYVRIHMLGVVDIACVLAFIGLGQILFGAIYFVLAPFIAHAVANAYYYGEDERKYENNPVKGNDDTGNDDTIELTDEIKDDSYNNINLKEKIDVDDEEDIKIKDVDVVADSFKVSNLNINEKEENHD